jgi:Lipocalin-like domain
MRRRRLVPAAVGVLLPLCVWAVGASAATPDRARGAQAKAQVVRQLAGSWQLLSFTLRSPDGTLSYPYGKDAVGKLTYTRDGHQWATGARRGVSKNLPDAFWYTGTFDVNLKRQTIVHHVQYSSISAWEGTDLVRSFKLRGNRLTLTIAPTTSDGQTGVLTWKKLRGSHPGS